MKLSFFDALAIILTGIGGVAACWHLWADLAILLFVFRNPEETIQLAVILPFMLTAIVLLVFALLNFFKRRYATSALYGLGLIALPFLQAFCFLIVSAALN